ncbi:fam-a protein [Plasmodium vinckei petteri]|uniref:Fam-a protein n=1 Tax=Plasmodium vinckei petteri TaxID=138298 RepID=A0A6V7TCZ6_PLAVN|nr:fam-a protein [Plasmodium vinckei petteri]
MSKFYIQIVLFLLSISVCLNNTTLAAGPSPKKASQKVLNKAPNNVPNKAPNKTPNNVPNKPPNEVPNKAPNNVPNKVPNNVPNKAPNKATKSKLESPYTSDSPEEIFEKKIHLLCDDPEETKQASELMDEAVVCLAYHATNNDDSKSCKNNTGSSSLSHKKKDENSPKILKTNRKIYDFGLYNEIVNLIWNPENPNFFINESAICKKGKTRKIVRVYDPNLIMIQQRYTKGSKDCQKYFYALAKKAQISENKVIIVMSSANINDKHPSKKEYKNTIIENANLFKTDVDSEKDIQEGKLKKMFVNIAGYLIENIKNHIHITYIESIDEENST